MEQMSLFGLLPVRIEDIPCGEIKNESLVGNRIEFQNLKERIGQKVVLGYLNSYKVVKILRFIEDCDAVYVRTKPLPEGSLRYGEFVNDYIHDVCGSKESMKCYELSYRCSRVCYTSSDKKDTEQSVSEMYCVGGRHRPIEPLAEAFYELNVV